MNGAHPGRYFTSLQFTSYRCYGERENRKECCFRTEKEKEGKVSPLSLSHVSQFL